MIKAETNGEKTMLTMLGSPSNLATEMAHVIEHVAEKIIAVAKPEDRTELAATLATGWSYAVRNALHKVQSHD